MQIGTVHKILAVRNDRFGEFLLNIPAFKALKQRFPESEITLAVDPYVKELAECIEPVKEVIAWENRRHKFREIISFCSQLRRRRFDICIIFNPSKEFNIISLLAGIPVRVGYARKLGFLLTHKIKDEKHLGLKHEIEYNLDLAGLVGANTTDKQLSLKADDGIIKNLFEEFGIRGSDSLVAVHPWTSDPVKQWPQQYFVQLIKRLTTEFNGKVIIIGATDQTAIEKEFASDVEGALVNLTNRTTLKQLAAVLKRCKLLVSGDSGPVHLASCMGIPVVAIFRSDLPGKNSARWGPSSRGSIVVEKSNLSEIIIDEVLDKAKEVLRR